MKYSEKLRNPKWQKKKNRILERDNYTCQHCWNKEQTLVVHHLKYQGDPWEVPDDLLITLCWECHEKVEFLVNEVRRLSGDWEVFDIFSQVLIALKSEHISGDVSSFLRFLNSKSCRVIVSELGCLFEQAAQEGDLEQIKKDYETAHRH